MVDNMIKDAKVSKSCNNPISSEKKVMYKNWMQGHKRAATGKTWTQDKPQIKAELREAMAFKKKHLYGEAG